MGVKVYTQPVQYRCCANLKTYQARVMVEIDGVFPEGVPEQDFMILAEKAALVWRTRLEKERGRLLPHVSGMKDV